MSEDLTETLDSEVGHRHDGRLEPGQRLGSRYEAMAPLGAGGMGTLWRVRHQSLGTDLALKLLHGGAAASESAKARFNREARCAASIVHPNVVRVIDHHVDEQFGPFLVMELVRGRTLRDWMIGSMPPRDALGWLRPIAAALEAIHAAGIVHRDVKPENIMRTEEERVVKLVDFGLAAHTDGSDRLTHRGILLGTPLYVAPELGLGAAAGPTSDVYSFAAVAFELLSGEVPFDGSSGVAVLNAKLNQPLMGRQRLPAVLPASVADLLESTLSPEPNDRPESATEFIGALVASLGVSDH